MKNWKKTAKRALGGMLAACVGIGAVPTISRADNPIAQNIYTADPAPMVYEDTMYVYVGHDEDNSTWYDMNDWKCYSTKDMVNWTDHGTILTLDVFEWVKSDAWAAQCIERDGKFYFYAPVTAKAGGSAIGVAVADSPLGPFKDAIGGPLITTPEGGDIDPTVFIDDDGQAYLYWGNPALKYVKLNKDMVSYSGDIVTVELTEEGFRKRVQEPDAWPKRTTLYEEAPWIYKRNGIYYLIYAADMPEHIAYSTSTSPTGPWTFAGVIMPTQGSSFTNHPGIVDFQGHSYFVYHNGMLPGGGGFTRSVAVEEFEYGENGEIPQMDMTEEGPAAIQTLNPYVRTEAETIAWGNGIETEACSAGGVNICDIQDGDDIKVENVDFGSTGAGQFTASVACGNQSEIFQGGSVQLRLDSADGELIGELPVSYTGGWDSWKEKTTVVSGATGVHDLYLVFQGEHDKDLFHMDYWKFAEKGEKSLSAVCASVDKYKLDTTEGSNTANITAKAVYADGTSQDVTTEATMTVSPDNGIIQIENGTGKVTAKQHGEAQVAVTYQGKTDMVNLLVTDLDRELAVERLTLESGTLEVKAGTSKAITVQAEFLDGHTEDVTAKATYVSEDSNIAEVSEGRVTAKNIGETDILIKYRHTRGEEKETTLKVIVPPVSPYEKVEAETFSSSQGESITRYGCVDDGGTEMVGNISAGDWIKFDKIGFGEGAKIFKARVASGGKIGFEIRLDSPDGEVVGTMDVSGTGGWDTYKTVSCDLENAYGTHDVYLVFQGAVNFNWWQCAARRDDAGSCIASFSFDDEETGFADAKTRAKAEAAGTNELSADEKMAGKSLYLDGSGSNYLTVKDADNGSLLADYEAVTISYWSKVDGTVSGTNWSFMANKADTKVNERKYIGVIEKGNSVTIERCKDLENGECWSQGTEKQGIANNEWKLVTAVFTENETKLYINKECVQTETDKTLGEIFDGNSVLEIGKADWGEGEYFTGYLDEFKVYNYARSEEEIARYYEAVRSGMQESDIEAAEEAMNLMKNIGDITLTEECKAKIKEARDAYNSLSDDQKKLIPEEVVEKLETAEEAYKKLEEEQGSQGSQKTDQEIADEVIAKIRAIGEVKATAECKARIDAARAAYDNLTLAQKDLVTNAADLTAAEARYKELTSQSGNADKADIGKASVSPITPQIYNNGKELKPSVTVTYNGTKLVEGTDYTVSYKNNKNIGTATVTIMGKGNYTGSATSSFTITVKKGTVYVVGNYKYKITNANTNGKGSVTLTGVKNSATKKKLKKINAASTVNIGGKKFKVTEIGNSAFSGCAKATSATVGANIAKIGSKAFYNCKKLKKIDIKSTNLKSVGRNAIKGIHKKASVICPKKKTARYKKLFKATTGLKATMKVKGGK